MLFVKPKIKAYWWNEIPNFGDALSPLLLKRFADLDVERSPIETAGIASIGSILEHIPVNWEGYIVGSGKLHEKTNLRLLGATIIALRGPLSAKGFARNVALGDPGLLANELIEYQEKKWDLGILPHWQDQFLATRFKSLIPSTSTYMVISPSEHPLEVLKKIASSKRIVTSSLHGMILADAFGIPRRVEYCDKLGKDGGDHKFRDYALSINSLLEFGKMTEPNRNRLDDRKFEIYDAYRELKRLVK